MEDPRTFFAAERTLLAWIRTGLTVIGLGFVVARFGLFLRLMRNDYSGSSAGSTFIGVGLVLLGSVAVGIAALQHVWFCRELAPTDLPKSYWARWSVCFAAALAVIGLVLAIYILLRAGT